MTARGAAKLERRAEALEERGAPEGHQAIATARAHGDLKENAEYHAAKEQQGLMEARIRDIEAKLGNAQIIDVTELNANGKVVFGATVESRRRQGRHRGALPDRRRGRSGHQSRLDCRSARRSRAR